MQKSALIQGRGTKPSPSSPGLCRKLSKNIRKHKIHTNMATLLLAPGPLVLGDGVVEAREVGAEGAALRGEVTTQSWEPVAYLASRIAMARGAGPGSRAATREVLEVEMGA